MLDFGLTKMTLIGVVALVVLGPKRLPGVARTAGALFGRAQRYIDDVKAEVAREMDLDGLTQMRTGFESAASNVENTVHETLRQHESELNDAWNSGTSMPGSAAGVKAPDVSPVYGDSSSAVTDIREGAETKHRNWRIKRSAVPKWYKHATLRKTRLQSRASWAAWRHPEPLRRPVRFF